MMMQSWLEKTRVHWPLLRRVLTLLFFVLVAALIAVQARKVDWTQVGGALAAYRASTLLLAGALVALSYVIYSCFDLLGQAYIASKLSIRRVMGTAFVSFACNQNLGSLIGALAFRFRLYSRLGLDNAQISRIVVLSICTNWLGYSTVAGAIFALRLIELPAGWSMGQGVLQGLGVLMLGGACAYIGLCGAAKRRHFTLRGQRFELPSLRMALLQWMLSMSHWPATAAVMYVLLHGQIEFSSVLGTLMLSSVAAVITHIPAGIGVLEAVFVAVLGHRIAGTELLAALLAFRALYYLSPLALAGILYFGIEAGARPERERSARVPEASNCASH